MAPPRHAPAVVTTRLAARVLVVDEVRRVLLFRGFDPATPDRRYWFTVGGGAAPGEDPVETAARELREETGLSLPAGAFGRPVWHEVAEFPFEGRRYRQEQDFFLVRVPHWRVSTDGWDEVERRTVDRVRWWSVDELESTAETYYPPELPVLLRRLLPDQED